MATLAVPTPQAQSTAQRTRQRNHLFDFLRIVFALGVILAHSYEIHDGNRDREIFNRITHTGLTLGEVGVDGFFLLSGYLIVMSWLSRPKLAVYLQKRALRIIPGYLVGAVLTTIVVGLAAPGTPHWFGTFPVGHFLASVLTLNFPQANPVYPGTDYGLINGALWTIAYEFRCYLIVAGFGLCGLFKRQWVWPAITALLLTGFFFASHLQSLGWTHGTFIIGKLPADVRLTSIFFLGGCFYLFRDRILLVGSIASMAGVAIVLAAVWSKPHFEVLFAICFSYILFYWGDRYGHTMPWMHRVPDISYGIYLYGWPAVCLLIWFYNPAPFVIFLLASTVSLLLGLGSWHLIESPTLKLKWRPTAAISSADETTAMAIAPS